MAIKDSIKNGARFDGDTYSAKYFGVSQNISNLKKGKNAITLSPSQFLKEGSPVQIELFDSANRPIKVVYPNKVSANNDFLINIIIGDAVAGGRAEAFIRGTATKNPDTGQIIEAGIPVIWYGLVDIKLEDDVITPKDADDLVMTSGLEHVQVTVTPKDITYQTGSAPRHTTVAGAGTINYYPLIQSSNVKSSVANKPEILTSDVGNSIAQVAGSVSTTNKTKKLDNADGFPYIVSTAGEFTSDMVNGIISVTPDISSFTPSVLIPNIGSIPTFEAVILQVINETTIALDTHFTYTIPGAGTPFPQGLIVDRFTSTDYDIEYNKSQGTGDSQKITGYAHACFNNTSTDNGKIGKVKVSVKPVGAIGSPMELGEFEPMPPSKMEDEDAYMYDPVKGLQYKPIGQVTSLTDITTYFDTGLYQLKTGVSGNGNTVNYDPIAGVASVQQSNAKLLNSVAVEAPGATNQVAVLTVKDAYAGNATANTEYAINLNVYSEGVNPEMWLYIAGPGITEGGDTSNFGTLVERITGTNGQTQTGLNFIVTAVDEASSIKPYLVVKSGTWHVSGLNVQAASSTGNSPNEICVDIPLDNLPVNKIGEEYVFVFDFIGEDGKPLNLDLISQGIPLNENSTIDEQLIINTFNSSTLVQNNISGSFNAVSASFSTTITNVSSSLAADLTAVSASFEATVATISGSLINAVGYAGSTLTLTKIDGSTLTTTIQGYGGWNLRTKPLTTSPSFPVGLNITDGACVCFSGSLAVDVCQKAPGNIIQVCHVDTSTQASCPAASRTYITCVGLDTFGHVTALTTGQETVTDTNVTGVSFPASPSPTAGCGVLTLNRTAPLTNLTVSLDGRYCTDTGPDTNYYADSLAFNTGDGILTVGRTTPLTDLTVDLDGRYCTDTGPDTNYYADSLAFNTGDGILTVGRTTPLTDLTVDLDGRYCTSVPTVNSAQHIMAATCKGLCVSNTSTFNANCATEVTTTYAINYGGAPNPGYCCSLILCACTITTACTTQDYLLIGDSCCPNPPSPIQCPYHAVNKMLLSCFFNLSPATGTVTSVTAGTGLVAGPNPTTAACVGHPTPGPFTTGGSVGAVLCFGTNSSGHIVNAFGLPSSVHSVASGNAWISVGNDPSAPVGVTYCKLICHAPQHPDTHCVVDIGPINFCFDICGHFKCATPS